jgi:hypothetical protein
MIAYLDTNVFDHLYKKIGCTGADIANLRKAIYGRQLSVPLSIHTLEEILLVDKTRPHWLVAQVKLTLSIASFRRLVKPCDQLLADDIRAYAARGEADRPYLGSDIQNVISAGISELVETDGEELDEEMMEALTETRQRKERFVLGMKRTQEQIRPAADQLEVRPTFEDYFQGIAPGLAEGFAQRQGMLDACRQRGIDGLLKLKSVRMAVASALSFTFGQTFEGWSPQRGDLADLHHAASAAAVADTFVTDDQRLLQTLSRVPFEGFEVIDLPGFLARLN